MAREQRKLAAILAADVVAYARLMGRDESGMLVSLRQHRSDRLEPALVRDGAHLTKWRHCGTGVRGEADAKA